MGHVYPHDADAAESSWKTRTTIKDGCKKEELIIFLKDLTRNGRFLFMMARLYVRYTKCLNHMYRSQPIEILMQKLQKCINIILPCLGASKDRGNSYVTQYTSANIARLQRPRDILDVSLTLATRVFTFSLLK